MLKGGFKAMGSLFDICRRTLAAAVVSGELPPATESLVGKILMDYRLDPKGIHGPAHWLRVMDYGRMLGEKNGANLKVVALFGLIHDARRISDRHDPCHGARAASYARDLAREGRLRVSSRDLDVLCIACEGHTAGRTHPDLTVRTCWDADRLDLRRFGWEIDPGRLNTPEAVELASRPEIPVKNFLIF
jgi:uncharacterized protein